MAVKTTVWALALLLLVPSSIAWTQLGGDAGHTGSVFLAEGPLDVVSITNLADHGLSIQTGYGPNLVGTPQGLAFFATHENDTCRLAFMTTDGIDSIPMKDCRGQPTSMVAYDEMLQLAYICSGAAESGSAPLLHAVDLVDGTTAWTITPNDIGAQETSGQFTETPAWSCQQPALDPDLGVIYLAAHAMGGTGQQGAGTDHRIAAVLSATGDVQWSTFLDTAFYTEESSGQDAGFIEDALADEDVEPAAPVQRTELLTVTRTTTGLVVAGEINDERMLLSLDLEGRITDFEEALQGEGVVQGTLQEAPTQRFSGSEAAMAGNAWAVARGPVAVAALGNDLVLIDPLSDEPQVRSTPSTQQFIANDHIGPALLQDIALVPSRNSLLAVDGGTFQPQWQHQAFHDTTQFSMLGAIVSTDGRIFTLEDHPNHGERVVLIDAQNGRSVMEWTLPLEIDSVTEAAATRFTAAPGVGLVVVHGANDTIVRLDTRTDAPSLGLQVDDEAPASGSPMELTFDTGVLQDAVGYRIFWGDGAFTTRSMSASADHIYFEPGEKTIAVVAERADGTTITDTLRVDVDGEALSWVEERFLPDNLDTTWGVIGLGVALIGGAITIIITTMRRKRMKREMDQIDTIRELAIDEPILAMQRLRNYRHDLRERAKRGKIDDPPLGSILQEVSKLFHVIEQRMLTAFGTRMSASMRHAMDAAFADGVLSAKEITDLQARLGKEMKLSKAERDEFKDLLANWV